MKFISKDQHEDLVKSWNIFEDLESGDPIEMPAPAEKIDDVLKLEKETVETREDDYPDTLDLTIDFSELPKIWQQHILERKKAGYLPENKNTFTKYEILKASSDEESFTSSAVIDKLFDRIKKEKIDLADLPKEWREILKGDKNINVFDNVTVEYLLRRGALPEDINKIREIIVRKKQAEEQSRKEDVRNKIDAQYARDDKEETLAHTMNLDDNNLPEPIPPENIPVSVPAGRSGFVLDNETSIIAKNNLALAETSFWGRTKNRFKSIFGRE